MLNFPIKLKETRIKNQHSQKQVAEGIGILLLLLIIEKRKNKKIAGNAAF